MSTAQVVLITGLPGNGKTLLTISKIDEWYPDRPVYYHNIKGLKKSWLPMPDPDRWFELPEGSVMVFDECQDVFPTRTGKEPVPEKCKAFEKLRHKGHSVVLITQKPRQIDIHVRQLVGMHIHVERLMGAERSVTFTWPKVCEDVDDRQNRTQAVKGMFAFPREQYGQYHSAEIHTFKRKIPWPLLAIPFAVAGVVGCAWLAYDTLIGGKPPTETASTAPAPIAALSDSISGSPGTGPKATGDYIQDRIPVLSDFPQTAPAYAELIKPVVAPFPAACVASRTRCKCYTQQATHLEVSESVCRQIAAKGYFVDWNAQGQGGQVVQPQQSLIPAVAYDSATQP